MPPIISHGWPLDMMLLVFFSQWFHHRTEAYEPGPDDGNDSELFEGTGILQLPSSAFETHSPSLVLHRFLFATGYLSRSVEMGATVIN